MREIKFRGKRKDNGEWAYGNLLYQGEMANIVEIVDVNDACMECGCPITEYIYNVDPKTVGQYTGTKDSSGKEIYEGDIVTFRDANTKEKIITGQVEFIDSGWVINYQYLFMLSFGKESEIIGDIHDGRDMSCVRALERLGIVFAELEEEE